MAIRAKVLCELAQYIYPKRKAVEHTGEAADTIVEWRFTSVLGKDKPDDETNTIAVRCADTMASGH
ncbi:MAG: hypothetical protein ABSE57_26540 [Bryobacteraceae bacterium]